jgi:hypothetical protein
MIMHDPDGMDYPNLYVFDRIEEHKQLVYTSAVRISPLPVSVRPGGHRKQDSGVLKARFISEEDKRKHVEELHAIEGSLQLLQRLEEQAR